MKSKGLPAALWALTISAFGIGTTEFVIVGLLPTVANDLHITIPSAGLLVSLYAIGVAIGAPVLTALTSGIPRKRLLISLMGLFIIGNALAAIAPGFYTLVVARIVTGFAHGVFFSVGATIAASLVPAGKRASAISHHVLRPYDSHCYRRAAGYIHRSAFRMAGNIYRRCPAGRHWPGLQHYPGAGPSEE
nr:MFS transporter [Chitinophaga sp. XS-30]